MDIAGVARRWRQKKQKRAAATAGGTLPDDVVLEILGRVADAEDVVTLFRCATACKAWLDLLSDPSFLRGRHRPETSSSLLIGFFAQPRPYRAHTVSADPILGERSPAFVPAPRSPLGPARRSLGSFVSCVADNLDFDDAVPLVARHGLLLVRLVPRRGAPADDVGAGRTLVHLAVCNLVAGTCDMLPPLKCRVSSRISSCAILTDRDSGSCSNGQSPTCGSCSNGQSPLPSYSAAFSKVLVIVFNGASRNYNLCTFSSAESSWSPPPRYCFSSPALQIMDSRAVICQGMACWLVSDSNWQDFYTLEVGVENDQFFLTDLVAPPDHPDYYGIPLLSVAIDGTLSMLRLDADCCWLETWIFEDGDDGEAADWQCTKVFELKPPEFKDMTCLCVGEMGSSLLVMDTLSKSVCLVDIKTGAVDEVTGQFRRLKLETAMPFEMDWTAFFLSRLEGARAKVRDNP